MRRRPFGRLAWPGSGLVPRHPEPVSLVNPRLHLFNRFRIGCADAEFVPGDCPLFGLAPAETLTLEFFHPGSNDGEIVGSAHRDFFPQFMALTHAIGPGFGAPGRATLSEIYHDQPALIE